MKPKINFVITVCLIIILVVQTFCGCSDFQLKSAIEAGNILTNLSSSGLSEDVIKEDTVHEEYVTEDKITESEIKEHTIREDGIYETRLSEDILCETYVFEMVITENSVEEFEEQLPAGFEDYDINWAKVITKLAIGTSAIIAVGIIHSNEYTRPIAFAFSTPQEVAKGAFELGATTAAINVAIGGYQEGGLIPASTKKYAIEGFADGYMWGAIASVLNIDAVQERVAKKFLPEARGFQIVDGYAIGKDGEKLGTVWNSGNAVYILAEVGSKVKIKGKYAVNGKKMHVPRKLPKNSKLKSGKDTIYTDDLGRIMRKNDKLLPNIQYRLKGAKYCTDKYGRITSVQIKNLKLKDGGGRLSQNVKMDTLQDGTVKPGYDVAHLFSDRYGGDNTIANLVPMTRRVNRSEYKKIENAWGRILKNNGKVKNVKIEVTWSGSSNIPEAFTVTYKKMEKGEKAKVVREVIQNTM